MPNVKQITALCAVFLVGCGSGKTPEPDLDLVPVTGMVTLNGEPLADAEISFLFDGKPPAGFAASGAKSDSSGKFVVMTGSKPGTCPGRYRITISRWRMPDGSPVKADPESGMDLEMLRQSGQLKQTVPDRYSNPDRTELSASISDSEDDEPLELKLTGT
jgi:hypothetical protein